MFRFTIRDVLWLTVVVGLGLSLGMGWWFDRTRLARAEAKFAATERLLQHVLNLYCAETGQYMQVGEGSIGLSYEPTNWKPKAPAGN